jgi:riboflavin synthase
MFTGIIEAQAEVQAVGKGRLTVSRPASFKDIAIGSSIAVAGVCLSITEFNDHSMTFDVVGETQNKTTIGTLQAGEHINLERAMCSDDRFEGHMVQGHVEGVGEVLSVEKEGQWTTITIRLPEDIIPTVVHKGSITIDGVSLTVASVKGCECSIALIPQTLAHTTLGALQKGDCVNIETDVLGRYVHSLVSQQA